MKKRIHKKLNKKRLFLSLLLLCVIFYLYINSQDISVESTNFISSLKNDSEYDVIKQNIKMAILQLSPQRKIIKKHIWNINKMEMHLGVTILIGGILWLKMVVE